MIGIAIIILFQCVWLNCFNSSLKFQCFTKFTTFFSNIFLLLKAVKAEKRTPPWSYHNCIVIIIFRIQPSDEGEYLCQAKNPVGSIETSARLRVHSKPSFIKTPLDVSVEIGEVAKFECEGEGQPSPAIFWSREGQQVIA